MERFGQDNRLEGPDMDKEPFVSGAYRPEEDKRNEVKEPISARIDRAITARQNRRKYGPLRPPTEGERRIMERKLGEKEDEK